MGNCQAAEAATVVIQHPRAEKNNNVQRLYCSVTARYVMSSNPGHFVALIVSPPPHANATSANATSASGAPVKHLKLLRPDDPLVLGQVYRLVCFQDVLKEFAAKKCVKLAKLMEVGGIVIDKNRNHSLSKDKQRAAHRRGSRSSNSGRGMGKNESNGAQWKPALQSISELGS